jgi:cation diffusion facilitator family transporter
MILANAKNMLNDVVISSSVLIGLIFTFLLKMPVLDTITAMIVSFWIIWVAFGIYRDSSLELMDGVKDVSIYYKIIKSVEQVEGASNPHRIRVRKIADLFLIALDIEVDENILVSKAHEIAKQVEQALKQNIGNIYDVLIHVEPLGNEEKEIFGISRDSLTFTNTQAG